MDKESCERGYFVVQATDMKPLETLRNILFEEARKLSGNKGDADIETYFNFFHKLGLEDSELNDFRMSLIKNFNKRADIGKLVWETFHEPLQSLLGPDVAIQKSTNLVIHQPNDPSVPPVHRDAPPSSSFEIVIWVPLVHCFGTKSMYVLDRKQTTDIFNKLGTDGNFEETVSATMQGKTIEMGFGSAVLFWAGLIHAIPINRETETRWSLNIRIKNMFSPYGAKGLPDFFEILQLSPLTRWAIEAEKQEQKKDSFY